MSTEERILNVDGVEYAEKDWQLENRWIDATGRIQLEALAGFIDKRWNERTQELKANMKKEAFQQRLELSVMEFDYEILEVESADDYSKRGGDTRRPKMFTTSFPGRERGVLFNTLQFMQLRIGEEGDYHAMNDNKAENFGEYTAFPKEWVKLFAKTKQWKAMVKHLASAATDRASKVKFKKGKGGPQWFSEHWGPSAFHVASQSKETGSGVLVFRSWWAYDQSPWCKLEFLFCKCLAIKWPNSVYVVDGFDAEKGTSTGYFMKGNEPF